MPITIDDLYRTHRMQMVRLAILLVDDIASAEDVVQEAFAGLYRNWCGLRDRDAAIGYLRTAVVNGSRSMLRRRRTARAYVPPDPGTARSAESLAMLSTEHQAVVRALGDLAPRQREVLVLRYYGGLSEAEIAEATGLSKGTVKSTASRAVAKLGDIMRRSREGAPDGWAVCGRSFLPAVRLGSRFMSNPAGRGQGPEDRAPSRCSRRRCGRWPAAKGRRDPMPTSRRTRPPPDHDAADPARGDHRPADRAAAGLLSLLL